MAINQVMGMALGRSDEALAYLIELVEEIKSTGLLDAALQRHGIDGAVVAAPGYSKK